MNNFINQAFNKLLSAIWLAFVLLAAAAVADDKAMSGAGDGLEVDVGWGDAIAIRRIDHEEANVTVDGYLQEPAWATAPLFDEMRVIEPDTLAVPPYATEVRMFYTDKGLYASFDLEQPPDTIVKRYTVRDEFGVSRDNVSFTLDTSGEGRYAYWMNLSLGDVQMDGTVKPEREFSREWDGAWYGATQPTDSGWSAEFFVPWSQMAMPKADGVRRVGIYLSRIVAHLDERWSWPILPESQPRFLSRLQPISFEGVDPRQQWSLFPYASATHDRVDTRTRYKAGADVFWRPSTNFQLSATVNPDFGSVEADDVVVNLTADETFFPEKRLFFQEGQDIFATSPRAQSEFAPKITVVNTRRIGARPRTPDLPPGVSLPIREAVRPTDMLGAVKTTGQIGAVRYGLLAAIEDDSDFNVAGQTYFQRGRAFGAFRVLYEDDRGAAYRGLGFVSTLVAHPESDAVVNGIDYRRLSSNGVWSIASQLLHSDVDEKGSGVGGFMDVEYTPRQGVEHELQLTYLDDKIDINDLGFLVRNDTRDIRYGVDKVMSNLTRVRDAEAGAFLRYAENGDGFRTRIGTGVDVEATLNNLHSISLDIEQWFDRYDDRNSFGNGTFEKQGSTDGGIHYSTDSAKPLSTSVGMRHSGEALGGHTFIYSAGLTWRPRHNFKLNAEVEFQDRDGWLLHQEDGNFTTFDAEQLQPAVSVDYFASAKQQFRLVLQWVGVRAKEDEFFLLDPGTTALRSVPKPAGPTDDFSVSELNLQVRYRWQIAPLSDLFVVYTKGDSRTTGLQPFSDLFDESWNTPLGDQLVIKLRYRLGS
ncbi:MAG: hypothetical protein GY783_11810 [Gammaproteobacteria bacterium]|nr:hypothetical protein [Gammaproteobacteria bacterium]